MNLLIAGLGLVCHLRSMQSGQSNLKETFFYFLRLGFFGFGGPLALVASMQRDLVDKRRWMNPEEFIRTFALIKAMPGPVAFQTAVFLGNHRAGKLGATAAAIALNGPSFVMMVLFGVFYEEWGKIELSQFFLTGMQAAALGVILASLKGMAQGYWRKSIFWIVGTVVAFITALSPASEPLLIIGSGLLVAIAKRLQSSGRLPSWLNRMKFAFAPVFINAHLLPTLPAASSQLPLLFWNCFKAGAFVFGSGLAIVPMMEHDFVTRLGWLTQAEFLDALAFGQITPGPVVITATFIGFKSAGLIGAVVATIAVFLAPFIHMTTWFPRFVGRLAHQTWISPFLIGAIAAVVGAIVATVFQLSLVLDEKPISLPLLAGTLLVALWGRIPVWVIIPLGGVVTAALKIWF